MDPSQPNTDPEVLRGTRRSGPPSPEDPRIGGAQPAFAGDPSAVYAAVHLFVVHLVPARTFSVFLRDRAGEGLRLEHSVREASDVAEPPEVYRWPFAEWVVRTRRPLLATADTLSAMVARGEIPAAEPPAGGWLAAPILHGEACEGALVVRGAKRPEGFTEADLDVLSVAGRQLGALLAGRRQMEAAWSHEGRFRRLTDAAPCAIVVYSGGRLRYANEAARTVTGYGPEDLAGRPMWNLIHPEHRDVIRERARAKRATAPAAARYEFKILRKDGKERWIDFFAGATPTAFAGRPVTVGVAVDITDRKQSEARVRNLAYHDPLTGLANRSLLADHIDLALADARRRDSRVGVLFVDLDGFKQVNDTMSHAAGDLVLQRVADRLRSAVRHGDTVARFGGDEFVVLLAGIAAPEDAGAVGEKVLDLVRHPVLFGEREINMTASVGISVFPEDGTDGDALLASADAALYRAKEQGGGALQLYTAALHEAALQRMSLQKDLHTAVEQGQLSLDYQPVLDLRSGRVYGVEAFLRWRHPARGKLTPREFLPAMETSRAAAPIGLWTLRTACAQVKAWQEAWHRGLHLGVNLGVRQLREPELLPQVASVLAETGLAAKFLDLEIREDHTTGASHGAEDALRGLVALGAHIALDNFGTGASSLRRLRGLPIQAVKIDRSCVRELGLANGHSLATAIVRLGRTLQIDVVASGVETASELRSLTALECDRAQGNVYSPPLSAAECETFLRERP